METQTARLSYRDITGIRQWQYGWTKLKEEAPYAAVILSEFDPWL